MNRLNLVHLVIQFGIILVFLFAVASSGSAAPEADPGINNVYISKISDTDYIVSWTTDIASDGTVNYGTSTPPTNSKSDDITSTTTHYVLIDGLDPETTYYVSVTSDTATDDNGGLYYEIITGPTLTIPPGGGLVYGTLYESNGTTPVANGIVYIQLQDADGTGNGSSQWVASRTGSDGIWSFNLPRIRTSGLNEYFSYTTGSDNIRLNFQCGDKGNIGEDGNEYIVSIPTDDPGDLGPINCDDVPNAIEMTEFVAKNWSDSHLLLLAALSGAIIAALVFFGRRIRN